MLKFNNIKTVLYCAVITVSSLIVACSTLDSKPISNNEEPVTSAPDLAAELISTPYPDCSTTLDELDGYAVVLIESASLWDRIREGYQLDHEIDEPRLATEFNWYRNHPEYMERVAKRSERYLYHVVEELENKQMPLELALLPIVESAFDPFAYSHGRAAGMWQFIPGTGRMYELNQTWWYDGRRDVIDSTQAAIDYLSSLNNSFDGDWLLALAAYNSGRGTVNKAIRKNKKLGKPTDFWSLDLPRETRAYVPKLLAIAKLLGEPERYGLELEPIPNEAYFAIVDTQAQIDLAKAAALADIPMQEIYRLNPGLNRWATPPLGPHRLIVPIAKAEIFKQQLLALPPDQRLSWQRYKIKSGDSLLLLAKKFNTGVDTIRQINGIKGNTIRAGDSVLIPVATAGSEAYSLSAEQRLAKVQSTRKGASGTEQLFYTVQRGDSLWTIARSHGVTVNKIVHWNKMSPKDPLQLGQKLSIWTEPTVKVASASSSAGVDLRSAQSAVVATAVPRMPLEREPIVRRVGYNVRNGDSLARIADRFNVRVHDIVRWNTIDPKKYLRPGQHLTLFVDITNLES